MQGEFKYADLLDDDVFKLVFGRESSKDVMIEFLNQVIPDRKIFEVSELINMDEVTRSKVIEKMITERDLRNQMEYARQEAIAEGRAEGHAEGHAEGLAEGLAEAARKMLASGMALEVVADILQIPKDRLKGML